MRLIIISLLLLTFLANAQQTTLKLTVEPNHSTIGFSIPIAEGFTRVTGKFTDFDLKLDYVNDDLTQSKAFFSINARSINTGIPERDDHLRTADFFDVENYPQITFQTSRIVKSETGYEATGILSMHGVDKQVKIPLELLRQEKSQLGIQIRWTLNRIDFGIGKDFKHTAIENFLANDIDIEINFWTKRDKRE